MWKDRRNSVDLLSVVFLKTGYRTKWHLANLTPATWSGFAFDDITVIKLEKCFLMGRIGFTVELVDGRATFEARVRGIAYSIIYSTHIRLKNWIVLYLLYYISIVIGEYPTHAVKYPLNLQGNKIAQTIRVYPGYIGKNNQLNLKKGMRCTGNNRYNEETNQIFLRKIQSSFADDTKRTYH